MAPFLSVPDMLMKVLRYLVSHFSSMFLLVFLDSVFPPRDNNAYIGNLFPVSTGIWPQSLPEWAFRARLGFWQICLCPKVARIAEHKLGRLTVRAKLGQTSFCPNGRWFGVSYIGIRGSCTTLFEGTFLPHCCYSASFPNALFCASAVTGPPYTDCLLFDSAAPSL